MILPFFDYLDLLIDGGPKLYIDKLQRLQFRGIKMIYQYKINGEQITSKDEIELHNQLSLSFLDVRRKKHLVKMMYDLIVRKPESIAESKSIICPFGVITVYVLKKNV